MATLKSCALFIYIYEAMYIRILYIYGYNVMLNMSPSLLLSLRKLEREMIIPKIETIRVKGFKWILLLSVG